MAYPTKRGFLDYADNSDGTIIYSSALTSAASLGSAVVVGANAANISYNSSGVLLGSLIGINFNAALTAAQKTQMLGGFTISMWIESGFFSSTYLGGSGNNEWLLSFRGASASWGAYKPIGSGSLNCQMGGTTNVYDTTNSGKDTYCRFDMSYDGGAKTTFYLDGLPIGILNLARADVDPFSLAFGLGNNTLGRGLQTHRIKNFMIRTEPVVLDTRQKFSSIYMMGHSWAVGGDYANANAAIIGDKGTGAYLDARALPKIHRILADHGIGIPEGKIRNTGVAGVRLLAATLGTNNDLQAQIVSATTGGKRLKVVMLQFGINDVITDNTQSLADSQPSFMTNAQTQINSLITAGADIILIANSVTTANQYSATPSLNFGSTSPNYPRYKSRTDEYNAYMATLVANNAQCSLVDLFTLFGGHDNYANVGYFTSDDYHPNEAGYRAVGTAFANELIRRL